MSTFRVLLTGIACIALASAAGCHTTRKAVKHQAEPSSLLYTEVRGYVDNDFRNTKVRSIIVLVPIDDLVFRGYLEDALYDKFSSAGITVRRFANLFPPTRHYSDKEVRQVLRSNGIQALLVINLGASQERDVAVVSKSSTQTNVRNTSIGSSYDFGTAYTYGTAYPQVTGQSQGIGISSGNSSRQEHSTTVVQRMGSRDIKASVTLVDVSSAKKIWVGGLSTHTEQSADYMIATSDYAVAYDMGAALVNNLVEEKIVVPSHQGQK